MFESRCGICCDGCAHKAEVHCTGCLSMAQPFWGGACPVKSCCEGRGLDHCGLCPAFPCGIVSSMGADRGYDPAPRLEQCRLWAKG